MVRSNPSPVPCRYPAMLALFICAAFSQCRVQPFGLSLMKLIPTSPFLYACTSVRSTQKLLANLFTTSFASCQLVVGSCFSKLAANEEREGSSMKSNKSPSHDNATFSTSSKSLILFNFFPPSNLSFSHFLFLSLLAICCILWPFGCTVQHHRERKYYNIHTAVIK